MEKTWIIALTIGFFILLNFLFYKGLRGYMKKQLGKKMWRTGGSKLYFWQSSIFVSIAGTVLLLYTLKWANVLSF